MITFLRKHFLIPSSANERKMAFVIIKELVANNHIITRPEEYDT